MLVVTIHKGKSCPGCLLRLWVQQRGLVWHPSFHASKEKEVKRSKKESMAYFLWLASKLLRETLSVKNFKNCEYWISTKGACVSGLVLKPADLLFLGPQNRMPSVMLAALRAQFWVTGLVSWVMLYRQAMHWIPPFTSSQSLSWD